MRDRRLTTEEWDTIRRLGRLVRYGGGERLSSEGEQDQRVFAIESGEVRISLTVITGAERVIGVRGPGEMIGEMAALDGSPRSATMATKEPAKIYVLTADAFHEFLREHPEASVDLLIVLARRLRDLVEQHAVRSEDLSSRVAWRLAQLCEEAGVTRLTLTQQELADWIGATREATARVLREFREDGLVTTGRGWIEIHNVGSIATRR